tara:strand:+ start:436 stop:792 length:357 start_codon:yes stop_codon:yes gene_type:complete
MKFYTVKETGSYAFHTILDEWNDLSFTYKSNLNINKKVWILYYLDKNNTKEEYISYLKLEKYFKSKKVIAVSIYGKDYEIRIAGPELYIFSFEEVRVKELVKVLNIVFIQNTFTNFND